ncbi:hypothetical protein N0V93_004958 [Gnomoniopsis smithogilvyi]|uniref:Vps72/YL1 C-terminal domain-containing protein n=1 Tax=Gnomoniopsis smithogilvyi TaxID=1191159 RepID=A0A9W9CXN6_9PEZI|nr:hypothetical protein N0V93_004958 [Gnomoniopsis smithogilvyi]
MATDGDEPREASEAVSNADSIASSSDSESDSGDAPQTPVEWLATGRSKRSTAGNRMKSLLATETPADEDSDLELLFQEDADDVGFTDKEDDDGSDAAMESSDDEDENEAQDDDAGEKELERQAKEKKAAARKRKAQEAIPAKFRKKVRINHPPDTSSAAAAPAPRPKKKSERASWLPTEAEMPTRASGRKTTQLSKEQLHQQMIEREARRLKQVEAMERKAKKKEAMKKPPMTQAERLKEAAIVEKRNAKSLNRWEEAEKQREEERRAKLAALNNRRLEGPVVTFWTGIIDLSEVQLKHVGKMVSMEEKPKRKRPSTAMSKEAPAATSLKTEEGGSSELAQATTSTQDANGLPLKPETPQELEAPKVERTPVTSEDVTSPAPLSAAPAPSATSSSATAPSFPAIETPGQKPSLPPQPTPPPASLPVSPAVPTASSMSPSLTAPSPSPLPASAAPANPTPPVPSPIVKTEPQSSKPMPLALRPDIGPRFMPPPNPHFAQSAQSSPLPVPVGIPNVSNGQVPALGGYAATPVPRASSLSATVPASPRPFSPLHPSTSVQLPSISPPPSNPSPLAAFPPPTKQPSPVHTTASFEPISATALPTKATKKQQTEQAASKKSTSKTAAARKPPPPPEPPAPEPPMEGKVTRACIILQDFNEDAIKKPDVQTQILFGWKMNKLAKPPQPPLCVITNHPARYRDPKTGLPYYNTYAFKEIQKLIKRDFKWSKALGTWVGNGTDAAKGVPDRFLRPETEEERKERLERKEQEKKSAAEEEKKAAEAAEAAKVSERKEEPVFAPIPGADVAMPDAVPMPSTSVPAPTSASSDLPPPISPGGPLTVPSSSRHEPAMSNPAPAAIMGGEAGQGLS